MEKKVLLTGSAGFIGYKTAQMLLEDGNEVIGVDNINDYYDVRLKEYRLKLLKKYENFEFHKADIRDRDYLDKIFNANKFDTVINLAARAGVRYSIENPSEYITTNIQGTLNILELTKDFEIEHLALASSSSVYAGEETPFHEKLTVDKPISPYAASKKSSELIAYTYHYLYGINITALRYFTVYGPYGRPDMAYFRFMKLIDEEKPVTIFGDGEQKRDFTFVNDIARGTIKATKTKGYEIVNLGGGKTPVSINYMIRKISDGLDKKAKIEYLEPQKADMKITGANISKAKEVLDWQPETDFDEGIEKTVAWYKENRNWLKEINI